jgi:hypothetical protein
MKIKVSELNTILRTFLSSILIFNSAYTNNVVGFSSIYSDSKIIEGEKLIISDSYDVGAKEIEIGGNTLVNIADSYYEAQIPSDINANVNVSKISNGINIKFNNTSASSTDTKVFMGANFAQRLSIAQTHTLYFECETNLSDTASFNISDTSGNETLATQKNFNLVNGVNKVTFTTNSGLTNATNQVVSLNLEKGNLKSSNYINISNMMIIEGDLTNSDISYFEGICSLGESSGNNNSITIKNTYGAGENLLTNSNFRLEATKDKEAPEREISFAPDIKETDLIGKYITLSYDLNTYGDSKANPNKPIYEGTLNRFGMHGIVQWADSTGVNANKTQYPLVGNLMNLQVRDSRVSVTSFISPPEGYDTMVFFRFAIQAYRMPADNNNETWYFGNPKLEIGTTATAWCPNKYDADYAEYSKTLNITEPLNGLDNGVRDRIVKIDGKWYIERNTARAVLDGSEEWTLDSGRQGDGTYYFRAYDYRIYEVFNSSYDGSIKFFKNDKYRNDNANNNWSSNNGSKTSLDINRSLVISIREKVDSVDDLKALLKANPVTVIYERPEPVYELLGDVSEINIRERYNLIATDSSVPATLKIAINNTMNVAQESVYKALDNPTSENISDARLLCNNMPESTLKDTLQRRLNDIFSLDITIEKLNNTQYIDTYVKFKNTLSLSLNTSNITFDEFDATEDMEKKSAITMNITSTLPYNINSYLETEALSSKGNKMDKSIINIKASTDSSYKTFTAIKTPVALYNNQEAATNRSHSIDLKLLGGVTHKADVYKATLKLEVAQT